MHKDTPQQRYLDPAAEHAHTLLPSAAHVAKICPPHASHHARRLVMAVDGGTQSSTAMRWALQHVYDASRSDQVYLVTVLHAIAHPGHQYSHHVMPGIGAPGISHYMTDEYHKDIKAEELRVARVLKAAVLSAREHGVPPDCIHAHALPAVGGASGVADSLVEYCKGVNADLVVMGSRGLGAMKSMLMTCVGLGSVTDYALSALHCSVLILRHPDQTEIQPPTTTPDVRTSPVTFTKADATPPEVRHNGAVQSQSTSTQQPPKEKQTPATTPATAGTFGLVEGPVLIGDEVKRLIVEDNDGEALAAQLRAAKGGQDPAEPTPPKHVCVATDESPHARHALLWAIDNLLVAGDTLHLVVAAPPVPPPVLDESMMAIAFAALEPPEHYYEVAMKEGRSIADTAVAVAVAKGVAPSSINAVVVPPVSTGSADIARSIRDVAQNLKTDVLVVGSRGLGALRRSLLSFVGLGSISMWLAHHLSSCPLIVVKGEEEDRGAEAKAAVENGAKTGSGSGIASANGTPSMPVGAAAVAAAEHELASENGGPAGAATAATASTAMKGKPSRYTNGAGAPDTVTETLAPASPAGATHIQSAAPALTTDRTDISQAVKEAKVQLARNVAADDRPDITQANMADEAIQHDREAVADALAQSDNVSGVSAGQAN